MKLLDLFCGGGGAGMGYSQAGWEVVGVDLEPQKHYPFEFHQADAFEYLAEHWQEFDAIHGSPICKGYSVMNNLPWLKGKEYPLQILPLREALNAIGKPYVIENVMGARFGAKGLAKRGLEAHGMQAGWLCGTMFGLPFYRHRLFETNWFYLQPGHPKHQRVILRRRDSGERQHVMVYAANSGAGIGSGPEYRTKRGGPLPHNTGETRVMAVRNLENCQGNGAQAAGVGVGHAKGWRLAAEAMGIDWMNREELTQAIPPAYTKFIGEALRRQL
ncbi:MAG TPA: hypothetical protein VIK64_13660 [Anaerolineales bacterium]